MEDYYLRQEFKSNPARFFMDKMKQKKSQAEEAVSGVRKAADTYNRILGAKNQYKKQRKQDLTVSKATAKHNTNLWDQSIANLTVSSNSTPPMALEEDSNFNAYDKRSKRQYGRSQKRR